jgi:ribosome recycling factor
MEMQSVLSETNERMRKSLDAFDANVATVRTGRANPDVLSRVGISYYGTNTPLNQLATVSSPDPRTLLIVPFDKSVIEDIEKTIREGDLGFNPSNHGEAIYITVPALNDERRRELVRTAKNMAEEAKVAIRNIRRDSNDELKELQSENLLTEDDVRLGETEVQKLTDEFTNYVDDRLYRKENDIMEV